MGRLAPTPLHFVNQSDTQWVYKHCETAVDPGKAWSYMTSHVKFVEQLCDISSREGVLEELQPLEDISSESVAQPRECIQ